MVQESKPKVTEFTREELDGLVARCKGRLPPADHALLVRVVDAFLVVSRMVREGRATIRRLRRLFGLQRSEKKSKIFGEGSGPGAGTDKADATTDRPAEQDDETPATSSHQSWPPGAANPDAKKPNSTSEGKDKPSSGKPKAKGHGRRPASDYVVERILVVHDSLEAGCRCPSCERGGIYELKTTSPTLRFFGQPPLFAKCWDAQKLRCGACGRVYTAQLPSEALGLKYSESAAAVLATLRFGIGVPHYRVEWIQEALGTPLADATQWDVLYARAVEIYPAYQHLLFLAAQAACLHPDDTFVRVLDFMGKRREKLVEAGKLPRPDRTGMHTTGIVAITKEGTLKLFLTGRRHAGENLNALLEQRAKELGPPLLMNDALGHNAPKDHEVLESNCLAHGRRGVLDEAEKIPDECQYVIDQLAEVYAVDKVCREDGLSPDERLWMHQLVSAPVMKQLRDWMNAQLDDKRIEPNSGPGRAFNYLLKRWDKFTVFLRVAGAPLDNNICEALLKKAVLVRKNSLFFRSERGAVVGDIYMSLINTAIEHNQNPLEYLTALMENAAKVAEAPGDWMPWAYRQTLTECRDAPPPAHTTTTKTTAHEPTVNVTPIRPEKPPSRSAAQRTAAAIAAATTAELQNLKVPHAKANNSTSPRRRPKQPRLPPPAFVLAMLLCILSPFAATLHAHSESDTTATKPLLCASEIHTGHADHLAQRPVDMAALAATTPTSTPADYPLPSPAPATHKPPAGTKAHLTSGIKAQSQPRQSLDPHRSRAPP